MEIVKLEPRQKGKKRSAHLIEIKRQDTWDKLLTLKSKSNYPSVSSVVNVILDGTVDKVVVREKYKPVSPRAIEERFLDLDQ